MRSLRYGSLNKDQEKEFIQARLSMIDAASANQGFLSNEALGFADMISECQETIRGFAKEHIEEQFEKRIGVRGECDNGNADDSRLRSRSAVSLRDIQRVFSLIEFFSDFALVKDKIEQRRSDGSALAGGDMKEQKCRRVVLLTVALVYYLRLDSEYRSKFLEHWAQVYRSSNPDTLQLEDVLEDAMEEVLESSHIDSGVAKTQGLKENVFCTLVCSLARIPLVIVGPPGSSKTLSVGIVTRNAAHKQSKMRFYQDLPRLEAFHYQCTRLSTSNEVKAVFDRAIKRQEGQNSSQSQNLVFMDEAGLPEEDQESLKVLHYYLEGHMSARSPVSFVAITNHLLDAAKTNRCLCLLRTEPDMDELQKIAVGTLFGDNSRDRYNDNISFTGYDDGGTGSKQIPVGSFVEKICETYSELMKGGNEGKFKW